MNIITNVSTRLLSLASMAKNEERVVWDMTQEKHELRPVGDMNMATLKEDVDSEYGSQNGLQGLDVDDPAHEKKGLWWPWKGQGHQGKRIVADVRTTNKQFPKR